MFIVDASNACYEDEKKLGFKSLQHLISRVVGNLQFEASKRPKTHNSIEKEETARDILCLHFLCSTVI